MRRKTLRTLLTRLETADEPYDAELAALNLVAYASGLSPELFDKVCRALAFALAAEDIGDTLASKIIVWLARELPADLSGRDVIVGQLVRRVFDSRSEEAAHELMRDLFAFLPSSRPGLRQLKGLVYPCIPSSPLLTQEFSWCRHVTATSVTTASSRKMLQEFLSAQAPFDDRRALPWHAQLYAGAAALFPLFRGVGLELVRTLRELREQSWSNVRLFRLVRLAALKAPAEAEAAVQFFVEALSEDRSRKEAAKSLHELIEPLKKCGYTSALAQLENELARLQLAERDERISDILGSASESFGLMQLRVA